MNRRRALGTLATVALSGMAGWKAPERPSKSPSAGPRTPTPKALSGDGWRAMAGAQSIDPGRAYRIQFGSARDLGVFRPMLYRAVQQLQAAGVDILLTSQIGPPAVADGLMTVASRYRPHYDQPGMSHGSMVADDVGAVLAGVAWINDEYVQLGGEWHLEYEMWANVVSHELLHAMGMGHAAHFLDMRGVTPLMTSPNGGFRGDDRAGMLTRWDIEGIERMLSNHGH